MCLMLYLATTGDQPETWFFIERFLYRVTAARA